MQKWNSQWNHNSIVSASLNSLKLWNFSWIQSNYVRTCSAAVYSTHVCCVHFLRTHHTNAQTMNSGRVWSQHRVAQVANGFANILYVIQKLLIYFPLGAFQLHQPSHDHIIFALLSAHIAWLAIAVAPAGVAGFTGTNCCAFSSRRMRSCFCSYLVDTASL